MKKLAGLTSVILTIAYPMIASAQTALPEMKRQSSPQAVLDEHLDALKHCDWNRIVAQYPDDAQINLPGGAIVAGRKAIAELSLASARIQRTAASTGSISRSSTAPR